MGARASDAPSAEDPSTVVTGLQTLNAAAGASTDLSADLTGGTWVVLCFFPAADRQPSVAHGWSRRSLSSDQACVLKSTDSGSSSVDGAASRMPISPVRASSRAQVRTSGSFVRKMT